MQPQLKPKVFTGQIIETQENSKGVRYLSIKTTEINDAEYAKIARYRHTCEVKFTITLTHKSGKAVTLVA